MANQSRSSCILVCWQPGTEPAPALDWATRTAGAHGVRLVVYSSTSDVRGGQPTKESGEARRRHEEALRSFAARTSESGTECHVELSHVDPRVDLLDTAHRLGATLIVVGVNPASMGPGLLHLGSVTEFLAHHTDLPLAVVRAPIGDTEHLAVFVDGTDDGTAAVRWAAVHARRAGSETVPVILEPGMGAAPLLIDAAEELDADLVVVGAPAVGEVLGRRVGGVALKVLHNSARSIVLVPREQERT